MFHAVDAGTGRMLWSFDGTSIRHGRGANAAPVAYEVNGTEFIANAFGGNTADLKRSKDLRSATRRRVVVASSR